MARRVRVAIYDAVGGPAKLVKAGDGYYAGPTDAGWYRISHIAKHSSPSYPAWSTVRWGSDIREEAGEVQVMHDGKWQPLAKVTNKLLTKDDLLDRNLKLYGTRTLPKKWLFNDFGHVTCYFYKDLNHNGKRDSTEPIHKEYFHTTPDDEAATAAGQGVTLQPSHGCIHLKPNDIDELIKKKYFAPANQVIVHGYDATQYAWPDEPDGKAPFIVHFYPGDKHVIVTGNRRTGK